MNIKFVEKSKLWISISVLLILTGIAFIFINGLNLGVDFKGGSYINVNIGKDFNVEDIKSIVSENGVSDYSVLYAGEDKQQAIIRMAHMENQEEIQDSIINTLVEKYELTREDFSLDSVGATIGKELTRNALTAVTIAGALILLYIWIRFEIKSGVAAIVALLHDVLIMFAIVVIFKIQLNSPFVAAMLTIIGYSINDTIVVFDRIRENNKRFGRRMTRGEVVNKSINETLVRSLNTSLTTLFAVTTVYVLGVESIKEFALPILVGVLSGTYSSIFIASPIWALWTGKKEKKKLANV